MFTWLGIFVNQFFWSFLLLDVRAPRPRLPPAPRGARWGVARGRDLQGCAQVMNRFDSLKNVLRAVTYNRTQLLLTLSLGLVIMFLYSCVHLRARRRRRRR